MDQTDLWLGAAPEGRRSGSAALGTAGGGGEELKLQRPHAPPGHHLVWARDWRGATPAAALLPCSESQGAGRLQRRGAGRGGAEVGAGLCSGLAPSPLPDSTEPPAPPAALPPCRPASEGTGRDWGSLWGGARRAGPGQVHTAALCSGGCRRARTGCPGNRRGLEWRGVGAAQPSRPNPCCAESATAAAVPRGGGMGGRAERGVLPVLRRDEDGGAPSPGAEGAQGRCAGGRGEAGTSCSRLLPSSCGRGAGRVSGLMRGRGISHRAPPPSDPQVTVLPCQG